MQKIGRYLLVAVFLVTAGSFRRSQGLKSSSINPRMKKAKICCRKRMRRSSYFEQCILSEVVAFFSPKDGWFGLS